MRSFHSHDGRHALTCLAILLLAVPPALARPVAEPVTVEPGKPSLWTLEQAHYLLARLHATNDGLSSKFPDAEALDPNAIHGSRLDLLQTLISANVSFDEGVGVKNRFEQERAVGDLRRREALRAQLDTHRTALIGTVPALAELRTERARLEAAGASEAELAIVDQAIEGKQAEHDAYQAQITAIDTELQGLGAVTAPAFTPASSGASGGSLPDPVVGALAQGLLETPTQPKLHASRILDNHIQMQYEIIAKQLTLLRDEVGDDQQLIFLELPHSVYTVPKSGDDYLVRTEWKLTRYYREERNSSAECNRRTDALASRYGATPADYREPGDGLYANPYPRPFDYVLQCECEAVPVEAAGKLHSDVRVVDLIPRQSALNVNDVHGQLKGLSFGAQLSWLFGFGGGASFERRRETLAQFAQEEVFASAFGKGQRLFGWTFGPLPGTHRVAPGLKTTYAVLSVPRDARAVELEAAGCYYHRTQSPPRLLETASVSYRGGTRRRSRVCERTGPYVLQIPTATETFWLDRIAFSSVDRGQRVTVFLRGERFSPQTGVLVNGVPLIRVPSVARHVAVAAAPPATGVDGVYEIVNSRNVILTFSMGTSYVGTPLISLVTPAKVAPINYFRVNLNEKGGKRTLEDYSHRHPMFRMPLSIGKVEVIAAQTGLSAVLRGTGFRPGATILINGRDQCARAPCDFVAMTEYRFDLDPPSDPTWLVTIKRDSTQGVQVASLSLDNPLVPRVDGYEVLRFRPADEQGEIPARIDIVLSGRNLDDAVITAVPDTAKIVAIEKLTPTSTYMAVERPEVPTVLKLKQPSEPGLSAVVSVYPPQPPQVASVIQVTTGKPEGLTKGGYAVLIRGTNLDQVQRVFFGASKATRVDASPNAVRAIAPANGAGPVKVLLETDVAYRGGKLTNILDFEDPQRAVFTYKEPPKKNESNGDGKK